jgi:hypothetical protein
MSEWLGFAIAIYHKIDHIKSLPQLPSCGRVKRIFSTFLLNNWLLSTKDSARAEYFFQKQFKKGGRRISFAGKGRTPNLNVTSKEFI